MPQIVEAKSSHGCGLARATEAGPHPGLRAPGEHGRVQIAVLATVVGAFTEGRTGGRTPRARAVSGDTYGMRST